MKKRLISIGIVIAVIAAIVIINMFRDARGPFPNAQYIEDITEILDVDKDYYYVYCYQSDNKESQKCESTLKKHITSDKNLYFMNLDDANDQIEYYDWKELHSEKDKEIGQIVDGQIQYYSGESEEKYTESQEVNQYGVVQEWYVREADDDYLKENKNARAGYVYAKLYTPEIDYRACISQEKLILPEMPTLLVIADGKVKEIYSGYTDILRFFAQ